MFNPYCWSGIFEKIPSTSFYEILYLHSKYIDLRCFVKKLFFNLLSRSNTNYDEVYVETCKLYGVWICRFELPSWILGNWSFAIYYKWQNNNKILTCFWSLYYILTPLVSMLSVSKKEMNPDISSPQSLANCQKEDRRGIVKYVYYSRCIQPM